MNRQDVEELVLEILRKYQPFSKEKMRISESLYDDFNIDSFDMIEIIVEIELQLNISFPVEGDTNTVSGIVDCILETQTT